MQESETRPSSAQLLAHPWIRSWLRWAEEGEATAGPDDATEALPAAAAKAVETVDHVPAPPAGWASSPFAVGNEGAGDGSHDEEASAAASAASAACIGEEQQAGGNQPRPSARDSPDLVTFPQDLGGCDAPASETALISSSEPTGDLNPGEQRASSRSSAGAHHSGRGVGSPSAQPLSQAMQPRPPPEPCPSAAAAVASARTASGSPRTLGSSTAGLAPGLSLDARTLDRALAEITGPDGGIMMPTSSSRSTAPERALNAADLNGMCPPDSSEPQLSGAGRTCSSASGATAAPIPTSLQRLPSDSSVEAVPTPRPPAQQVFAQRKQQGGVAANPAIGQLNERSRTSMTSSTKAPLPSILVRSASIAARPASGSGSALLPSGSRFSSSGTAPRNGGLPGTETATAAMHQRPASIDGGNFLSSLSLAAAGGSKAGVTALGPARAPSFRNSASASPQGRHEPNNKPLQSHPPSEGSNSAQGAARRSLPPVTPPATSSRN